MVKAFTRPSSLKPTTRPVPALELCTCGAAKPQHDDFTLHKERVFTGPARISPHPCTAPHAKCPPPPSIKMYLEVAGAENKQLWCSHVQQHGEQLVLVPAVWAQCAGRCTTVADTALSSLMGRMPRVDGPYVW